MEWMAERLAQIESTLDMMKRQRAEADAAASSKSVHMEWVNVKERLPKQGEDVLIAYRDGSDVVVTCGNYWPESGKFSDMAIIEEVFEFDREFARHANVDGEITHWAPLPEPPKE